MTFLNLFFNSLSRVAIDRNLKDRFQKEGFWDKYGQTIMNIIFAVVLMVCVVVVMTKTQKCIEVLREVIEIANNMRNCGGGVVPA